MKKLLLSLAFLPLLLIAAPPAFATSFSDTFTDLDGTTLHDHNSIWECDNNRNNSAIIQNNKAVGIGDTVNCVSNAFDNGSASIVADFAGQSSQYSAAIIIRHSDANNYYQCNANSGDGYVIFKMFQGNFSVLQNNSGFFGAGEHVIACHASGSTITLTVDGVQRAQVTDSDIPSGRAGIQIGTGILSLDDYSSAEANLCSYSINNITNNTINVTVILPSLAYIRADSLNTNLLQWQGIYNHLTINGNFIGPGFDWIAVNDLISSPQTLDFATTTTNTIVSNDFTIKASDSLDGSNLTTCTLNNSSTTPTNKDQCKKDGWKNFTNPTFKNQGACVNFVEKQK
jgi:hypothetical protein